MARIVTRTLLPVMITTVVLLINDESMWPLAMDGSLPCGWTDTPGHQKWLPRIERTIMIISHHRTLVEHP